MPKQPKLNGTPGKKPPASSVKVKAGWMRHCHSQGARHRSSGRLPAVV